MHLTVGPKGPTHHVFIGEHNTRTVVCVSGVVGMSH